MTLSFEYFPIPFGDILLPIVPVRLRHGRRETILGMLVDSGADYSSISGGMARDLGLDPDSMAGGTTLGIGGVVPVKRTSLEITLERGAEGYRFTIPVHVIAGPGDSIPLPVLGRLPVFDHFDITFRQRKKRVDFVMKGDLKRVKD